jgi:FkbM family methyltransferase
MEPWKGHGQLLAALARLIDDPRWVCWIAGSAQREQEVAYVRGLRAMSESLGVARRVRFLGQRTDIPRLLAAADVHCQPNVEAEPFGVVFIEALSAGRPVVTTDLGGAREIVDDSCGILVPPGDTARLAESLRRLIDEPALRSSLGGHGPARARQLCDPTRQLSRLDEICARACGDARSRSAPAPWWLSTASTVIRRLPAGRYRASAMLARVAVRPFMARTPAMLGEQAFQVDWDDRIARDVCLMGVYEPQETALLRALLRRGMTCVDVGANWGYFTLLAAHLTGVQGMVVALEPDPRLFPTLRRNVEANGLEQVEMLQLAASDASGSCWLEGHDRRSGNLGTSHVVHAVRDGVSTFRVETSTIDALLDERNVRTVDLLKMDIEGGEALALRGMRDGLAARRYTRLLLELHPTMLGEHGSSVAEVVAMMLDAGYRGWWIDHSAQAVRRASYARRIRPSDYLRPIDETASEVAWPHTLWVAPHAVHMSLDA